MGLLPLHPASATFFPPRSPNRPPPSVRDLSQKNRTADERRNNLPSFLSRSRERCASSPTEPLLSSPHPTTSAAPSRWKKRIARSSLARKKKKKKKTTGPGAAPFQFNRRPCPSHQPSVGRGFSDFRKPFLNTSADPSPANSRRGRPSLFRPPAFFFQSKNTRGRKFLFARDVASSASYASFALEAPFRPPRTTAATPPLSTRLPRPPAPHFALLLADLPGRRPLLSCSPHFLAYPPFRLFV